MGKKLKKKDRAVNKEKRFAKSAPASQKSDLGLDNVDAAVVPAVEETHVCPHFDKGLDLVKVSSKLGSSEIIKCEDCSEESFDRRASKTKGKKGKKKGGGSVDTNSGGKAIWVCLECGHFSCGGIGLPTIPHTHAVRHAKQNKHHLAIQYKNPHLRWCFPCSNLISVEDSEENAHTKDVLCDIVKLMKAGPSERSSIDVEDVWFESGSVVSGIKRESTVLNNSDTGGGYKARGLSNLGNTCFFNSVLQNLLAMPILRDYFLKMDESIGPLAVSLKKIFIETNSGSVIRNVITPKALLGCVCMKAPQFRGFQQHDSHELLRCLLDGLRIEEPSARKHTKSLEEEETTPNVSSTFVDAIFGGVLCSTVSCLICSHSSIVHEPFLDLSLPIPSKRPPSKKANPVPQPQKTKLPPKRSQRICSKVNRSEKLVHSQNDSLNGDRNSSLVESRASSVKDVMSPSVISTSDLTVQTVSGNENVLFSEDIPPKQESHSTLLCNNVMEKTVPALEDTSWLDYLEPGTVSTDCGLAAQENGNSAIIDADVGDASGNVVLLQNAIESCKQGPSHCMQQTEPLQYNSIGVNYSEPDGLSSDNKYSQRNDKSAPQYSVIKDATLHIEASMHGSESSDLVLTNYSSCKINFGGNSLDTDPLLQVQSSEVLILPRNEESSSTEGTSNREAGTTLAPVGYEQYSMDLGKFGDLFNEPDIAEVPLMKPPNKNEVVENGNAFGNRGGSDLDGIDNTNSPISVKRCLSYFTKPELLLRDEHGWHCENCSKILLEYRRSKKSKKFTSNVSINGGEDGVRDILLASGEDFPLPVGCINLSNGNNKRDVLEPSREHLMSSNGSIDGDLNCKITNNQKVDDHLPVELLLEKEKRQINVAFQNLTVSEENSNDSCNSKEHGVTECYNNNGPQSEPNFEPGEQDSGDEDEEVNSEPINVKSDASKRILFDKTPPILTIHLKRFSRDGRGRISKLQGHVDFRDLIDLRPYMHPRSTERSSCVYRLLGVVEHLGSMRQGHYVAYVRGGLKNNVNSDKENSGNYIWYYASDAYVREVTFEQVLRCDAYILFYEKI